MSTVVASTQLPGCLPDGYDENSMLTREEFCKWKRVSRGWFQAHKHKIPGVVTESRLHCRIHVKTHIEGSAKK